MSYQLVKGTFRLFYQGEDRHVGSRPDGDSVWFEPDQPALLSNLAGRSADFNRAGFAQLRFEGIDALELHYPGGDHQHAGAATAARDLLLQRMGFGQITYAPNDDIPTSVRSATPQSRRGYILARTIDPFGRPVAFVYVGNAPENDGAAVFLDVPRLNQSLNAQLMVQGQVYPAYYTARNNQGGLPTDLRDRLTDLAVTAWIGDRGVWPVDDSRNNPRIRDRHELMELAIWPKLYRRLAKYFRAGNAGLGNFDNWLRAEPDRDDEVWIIPTGELGNLHDIVDITSARINMRYWPEELMIVPR
jgi:hypothetical protein